jgi:hypothetical protein
MKVRVTIDFSDEDRVLLYQHWTGSKQSKKVSRKELEQFIRSNVQAALVDYKSQQEL